jgi:hypothetical protein
VCSRGRAASGAPSFGAVRRRLTPALGDYLYQLMTRESWFRMSGVAVTLLGVLGFFTVADDLRHTGELWGTGSFLAAGLCLLVAGSTGPPRSWLAFQWLGAGFALGIPLGAWLDNMPVGVSIGAGLGLALAYLRRSKSAETQ